ILVNDAHRLWLLSAATGQEIVPGVDVVATEAQTAGTSPSGLSIDAIVPAPNQIYLGLATATLALDGGLKQIWRVARRPGVPAPTPVAGTDDRLLTHNVLNSTTVQIGLRETRRGDRLWFVDYEPGQPLQADGGPGGSPPEASWNLFE